jgi:hypothetical protein
VRKKILLISSVAVTVITIAVGASRISQRL